MQKDENITRKKIGVVNKNKLKNLKYHLRRITFAIALVVAVGKGTSTAFVSSTSEYIVPSDYIEMNIDVSVSENTKIPELAEMYYVEDIYPNFNQYCDMIRDENIIPYGIITPYQNITVPVIVNKDNIYLNNIKNLEKELETLPIWVEYEIQIGDTLSSLAYLGAKDSTEAMEYVDRIRRYNDIDKRNLLYIGDKIYIINPKIGEIKRKIYSLEENLKSSLIVTENSKHK